MKKLGDPEKLKEPQGHKGHKGPAGLRTPASDALALLALGVEEHRSTTHRSPAPAAEALVLLGEEGALVGEGGAVALVVEELLRAEGVEGHRRAAAGLLGVEVRHARRVDQEEAQEEQDLIRAELASRLLVLPLRRGLGTRRQLSQGRRREARGHDHLGAGTGGRDEAAGADPGTEEQGIDEEDLDDQRDAML